MKKFKQLTALLMTAAAVLFGFSTAVSAETVSSGESNADIEFIPGTDAPEVVDPEDPGETYPDPDDREDGDPTDEPTGNTGPLTLDFVSSVTFGENEVSADAQKYQSETLRPFIQVTDRRGTGEGWSVSAVASNFSDDEKETLQGAVLTFANGTVISPGETTAPTPNDEVVLNAGGDAASVVTAQEDEGMGKWINRWFPSEGETLNNNVTLDIPAGVATQGAHTATINWTLADAPGQ
jgi:hypothetical protein